MKIAATLILAALAAGALGLSCARAQTCPIGSTPSLDTLGNQICKRMNDGSTATTQTPRGQQCPIGAFPTLDNLGNKVCRAEAAGNRPRTDYYDTSKGCPIGTLPGMDVYGNKVCKPI
jgi:hypothetical protein